MTAPVVYVERQHGDKSYAVYVGGNDDMEGEYDRLYSWGVIDGTPVTEGRARKNAEEYAAELAKELKGTWETWRNQ